MLREACRTALAKALGYPVAKIRPIREVEIRMEALEDLKQGRRGPAAHGLRYLAKEFKRDPRTIRRWVEAGYFPGAYQTEGGQWRIPPTSLTENRIPTKLQGRRLKVPNRSLKGRAEKRFARFNDEFTNLTITLLKQYLLVTGKDLSSRWPDLIRQLRTQEFSIYLKRFYERLVKLDRLSLQESINTLVLEYAKTKIQGDPNITQEDELNSKTTQNTSSKKPRKYRSAITVKYLAEYYGVHRSTIYRWIESDQSFKRKTLEIIAKSGAEAMRHEVQESYATTSKHAMTAEDDNEDQMDQDKDEFEDPPDDDN